MDEDGPQAQTLADLFAAGDRDFQETVLLHLMQEALRMLDSIDTKNILYARLSALGIERTRDDRDLMWELVTRCKAEFFHRPIRIEHIARPAGDNRPDWMLFLSLPDPNRKTSAMEYVAHKLSRADVGKGGKAYRDLDGRRQALRLVSLDEPAAGTQDSDSSDSIDLHDLIEDESASVAVEAFLEALSHTQAIAKLRMIIPAVVSVIAHSSSDARFEKQRALKKLLLEFLYRLPSIPEDELDQIMDGLFITKSKGHAVFYDLNESGLARFFGKLGYDATDKTAGKVFRSIQQELQARLRQSVEGGRNV